MGIFLVVGRGVFVFFFFPGAHVVWKGQWSGNACGKMVCVPHPEAKIRPFSPPACHVHLLW